MKRRDLLIAIAGGFAAAPMATQLAFPSEDDFKRLQWRNYWLQVEDGEVVNGFVDGVAAPLSKLPDFRITGVTEKMGAEFEFWAKWNEEAEEYDLYDFMYQEVRSDGAACEKLHISQLPAMKAGIHFKAYPER